MSSWSKAWSMTRKELKYSYISYVVSIGYFLIVALVLNSMTIDKVTDTDFGRGMSLGSVNLLVLLVVPLLGVAFRRRNFSFSMSNNSHKKRLIFLKQLPVDNSVIMLNRYQHFLICFLINAVIFFVTIYTLNYFTVKGPFHLLEYAGAVLILSGYSLVIGSLYMYWELLFSTRKYLLVSLLLVVVFVAIALFISAFSVQNLITLLLVCVSRYGFVYPIVSIAIAAVFQLFIAKGIVKKLNVMDFQE